MKEFCWTDLSGNPFKKPQGNPRTWIGAATGWSPGLSVLELTDLNPMKLNVGGIWTRDSGYPAVDIPYRAIYKLSKTLIAACWPVPEDQITVTQLLIKNTNPLAVWYAAAEVVLPASKFAAALPNGPDGRFDHAVLYKFFEQGFTPVQIARATRTLDHTVNYVYRKWKSGHSPVYSHTTTRTLNKAGMLIDMQSGLTSAEISMKYDCTVVTVNKLAKLHNLTVNRPVRDKSSATTAE